MSAAPGAKESASPPRIAEHLLQASVMVLEELCFVSPDPMDEPTSGSDALTVSIDFTGPAQGKLEVTFMGLPHEEIATAMLGEDGDVSPQDKRDALGELANVICGQLLPRIAGSAAIFDLGAPKVGCSRLARKASAEVALGALGGRIEVALHLLKGSLPKAAA